MKLSTKARIQELLEQGERWRSGPLHFYRLPSPTRKGDFGMLVAKKRFPKSVTRNRIRRLLREAWRLKAPAEVGRWDVLISAGALDLARLDLKDVLKWIEEGVSGRPF